MPNRIPIVLTSVRDCSSRILSFDELLLVSFSVIYNIKVRTRNNHLDEFKTKTNPRKIKKTQIEISNKKPCAGNCHVPRVAQVDHSLSQEVQTAPGGSTRDKSLQFELWIYTARGRRETTHLSL